MSAFEIKPYPETVLALMAFFDKDRSVRSRNAEFRSSTGQIATLSAERTTPLNSPDTEVIVFSDDQETASINGGYRFVHYSASKVRLEQWPTPSGELVDPPPQYRMLAAGPMLDTRMVQTSRKRNSQFEARIDLGTEYRGYQPRRRD